VRFAVRFQGSVQGLATGAPVTILAVPATVLMLILLAFTVLV
jgi:hypothetical protein